MTKNLLRAFVVAASLCAATIAPMKILAADASKEVRPPYRLGPQDKVLIKVYEWRPSRDEIYEWTAFKAEYVVNASGSLSLPLLGEVPADGLTVPELSSDLGLRLRDKMGLAASPDVTVEVVQFRPFFIVGAVDKPGEYPYRPGLTVLGAYAIAGGRARNAPIRLEREAIATRGDLESYDLEAESLLARMARLQAEMASAPTITWPTNIAARMKSGRISRSVKQEQLVFDTRRESFQTQIGALEQLQSFLEEEAASLEKQLEVHGIEIASVKTEYEMVQKLFQKGLTSAPRKLALERNMAQVRGDRLRLQSSLMRARQEFSKTKIAIVDLRAKRESEISTEMQKTQARLEELGSRKSTSLNLLHETEVIAPQLAAEEAGKSRQPIFRILHQDEATNSERTVPADTLLTPGDTVMVEQPHPDLKGIDEVSSTRPGMAPTANADALSDKLPQ